MESVALFSHYGGLSLLVGKNRDGTYNYYNVTNYTDRLLDMILRPEYFGLPKILTSLPLGRLEPAIVMVDFVRFLTQCERLAVTGNYYLGRDSDDGDNSDNGHFTIEFYAESLIYKYRIIRP